MTNLRELNLSHNLIKAFPHRIEWLQNLEVLLINDNKVKLVPSKLGLISSLKKLHLHENKIAHLPREISRLTSLQELSLEWFMYTKPANSRIQKSPEVIKSVCDFCRSF